ncbi:uncharacterized protein LOC114640606 isoform X2 [Grammomys surdaster]|uniref:uncharacterized protein LOC114640606 isoform X2 n=1 Tax=Grammomys surdaster TaxID=491861 RepID=UPI00109FA17B|nr:uncharacterized protein LOC114640606 isoform X2 [Grammomys surdaster]
MNSIGEGTFGDSQESEIAEGRHPDSDSMQKQRAFILQTQPTCGGQLFSKMETPDKDHSVEGGDICLLLLYPSPFHTPEPPSSCVLRCDRETNLCTHENWTQPCFVKQENPQESETLQNQANEVIVISSESSESSDEDKEDQNLGTGTQEADGQRG